jgi:ABC1 atypical kinase-like domain
MSRRQQRSSVWLRRHCACGALAVATCARAQVDLRLEARNLWRFNQNFSRDRLVSLPMPLYPWVSQDILMQSFEEGMHISGATRRVPARDGATVLKSFYSKPVFMSVTMFNKYNGVSQMTLAICEIMSILLNTVKLVIMGICC